MKYVELFGDFENIRETQPYVVGKVIDEAQAYIEHLEGKNDLLENFVAFLNKLEESGKTETKQEILAELHKIFPSE